MALKKAGVAIQLIAWKDGNVDWELDRRELLTKVDSYLPLSKASSSFGKLMRLARTLRYPSQVSARHVSLGRYKFVKEHVKEFAPDVIMVDGLFGWNLGRRLVKDLHLPIVCRSHNVEHEYIDTLRSKATSLRGRIAFALAGAHLRDFEFSALKSSARFYDISFQDLERWKSWGVLNGEWLPPLIDEKVYNAAADRPFDVGYLGNLYTPNNVEGLIWFVNKVVPCLRRAKKILIAGSRPCDQIRSLCAGNPNICLMESPERVEDVYSASKVMVNPIWGGSGVNMKTLEMLQTDLPIVSTPQGVAGLPGDVASLVEVVSDPAEFALAIDNALNGDGVDVGNRSRLLSTYFGDQAVQTFIGSLARVVLQKNGEV